MLIITCKSTNKSHSTEEKHHRVYKTYKKSVSKPYARNFVMSKICYSEKVFYREVKLSFTYICYVHDRTFKR